MSEGACQLISTTNNGYGLPVVNLDKHDNVFIPVGDWHKLSNPYQEPCRIVEIQYGTECVEEDIERKQ